MLLGIWQACYMFAFFLIRSLVMLVMLLPFFIKVIVKYLNFSQFMHILAYEEACSLRPQIEGAQFKVQLVAFFGIIKY